MEVKEKVFIVAGLSNDLEVLSNEEMKKALDTKNPVLRDATIYEVIIRRKFTVEQKLILVNG